MIKYLFSTLLISLLLSCSSNQKCKEKVQQFPLGQIKMKGELLERALKNFDRLESDIYMPENVFPKKHHVTSEGWPGDKEGRVILGLVLQAQATHRTPKYLEELIRVYPTKTNSGGYLGPLVTDTIFEQQLSCHGWLLRGLCEYYIWKKDDKVKGYIHDIISNLALPTVGYHRTYPIDPEARKKEVGKMAGTSQNIIGNWLLSSDIGCDLIFLDGLVQAYGLFPNEQTKVLMDEIFDRFFEMNLLAIKAQTHASLTGTRALIRYYRVTGEVKFLNKAKNIYELYRQYGMTENYENLNWFQRPTWTEPYAIVDAYMITMQLWQETQNKRYLNDAHLMYYNAIAHTQRANGGFGCDNCPHGHEDPYLKIHADEAYWCCTMRGGEGLARAINYSYFMNGDTLIIPFYHNSLLRNDDFQVEQQTEYPFYGSSVFNVIFFKYTDLSLKLFIPDWAHNVYIKIDDSINKAEVNNGYCIVSLNRNTHHRVEISFDMDVQKRNNINQMYAEEGTFSYVYGPLLLGVEDGDTVSVSDHDNVSRIGRTEWELQDDNMYDVLSPIYHLLDDKVSKANNYAKQIIF